MNAIMWILFGAAYLVFLGVLGSGMYFFITGAKANEKSAELKQTQVEAGRAMLRTQEVANRVADEVGRKLASASGLEGIDIGFTPNEDGPCQCGKCKARRGEGDV
ncbi:hypothetical protein [Glutamicibacter sp. NPDC090743]|uniref:hypothetical protein n=1 Tax=Glutamicibacter sp. NPDC090743 TaxID=3364001 RepID=UPI00382BB3EF